MSNSCPEEEPLPPDSIPIIDLRLLSHSDLLSLSSPSPSYDAVPTPQIDHSVFNESAGSRRQTFSRLRLSRRPNPQPHPPSSKRSPFGSLIDDSRLVSLLGSLFSVGPEEEDKEVEGRLFTVPVQFSAELDLGSDLVWSVPVRVLGEGEEEEEVVVVRRKRGRPPRVGNLQIGNERC